MRSLIFLGKLVLKDSHWHHNEKLVLRIQSRGMRLKQTEIPAQRISHPYIDTTENITLHIHRFTLSRIMSMAHMII